MTFFMLCPCVPLGGCYNEGMKKNDHNLNDLALMGVAVCIALGGAVLALVIQFITNGGV